MEKLIFKGINPALYKALKLLLQDIFNQIKRWLLANGRIINTPRKLTKHKKED